MTVSLDKDAGKEPLLVGLSKAITLGRLVWALVVIAAGGLGTIAGCLYGEGRARGAFEVTVQDHGRRVIDLEVAREGDSVLRAQVGDHERRIGAIEVAREGDRATWVRLLSEVSSIKGSLDTMKVWLKPAGAKEDMLPKAVSP